MFTRLLQIEGARVLATDLIESRLTLARKFGAQCAIRGDDASLPDHISRLTRTRGLDAAVIAVPSDAVLRHSLSHLRGGGQALLFAHTRRGVTIGLDLAEVCVEEKDLVGSYSADFTLQREVARLVFSRQLNVRPLITHRFDFDQIQTAIDLAVRLAPESLKIVLTPGSGQI